MTKPDKPVAAPLDVMSSMKGYTDGGGRFSASLPIEIDAIAAVVGIRLEVDITTGTRPTASQTVAGLIGAEGLCEDDVD